MLQKIVRGEAMTNIQIQKSKIAENRPRRTFSLEDKQKFYLQWKKSGLSISRFCKDNDLVHSAFANWCQTLSSNKTIKDKNDWTPVVPKEQPQQANCLQIQIKLSSTTKILISLLLFFMVLSHAIAIIW